MGHAAERDNRDPCPLVLPGEPVIHTEQARPAGLRIIRSGAGRHPVGIHVERDTVEGLVLLWWVIDSEHDDVEVAVARGVRYGHPAALVLPGEPAGHIQPV